MNPKDGEIRKGRRGRTTKGGATPNDARKIAKKLERSAKLGWPFGKRGSDEEALVLPLLQRAVLDPGRADLPRSTEALVTGSGPSRSLWPARRPPNQI